jgi:hypothetical protein
MTSIQKIITLSFLMISTIFVQEIEDDLEKLEEKIETNIQKIENEFENDINLKFDIDFDAVHGEDDFESVSIGVYLSDIDFEEAYELHYKECYGVQVSGIVDGSNAERAGIIDDDIIMEFGGVRVLFESHLLKLKKDYTNGDTVKVKVFRNGEIRDLTLTFKPKEIDEIEVDLKGSRLSVGYGGGGPIAFMPQFDYAGINNYIAQFGFNPIKMESGTYFGGYGMGSVGGGWFIGGMGGGMSYSQSFIDGSTHFTRNILLESGLGGVTLTKKVPLFTEKLILDFSTLIGAGETTLTLSQHSGNYSWDDEEISNGNTWNTTYTKSFFALYPKAGLLVKVKSWFGLHGSVGSLYALSTQDNWVVKNNSMSTVGGSSPESPNGLTYSIGIYFGS